MYGNMASNSSKTKLQAQIEENLKRVYDDALNEPVPDRFQALLDQLRMQDKQKEPKA
jgi:hypothetical protein